MNIKKVNSVIREAVTEYVSQEIGLLADSIFENLNPEDCFETEQLAEWAENNGYVKAE